jgi:enediyne biosynthesis protein E4
VELAGKAKNSRGVGARVVVRAAGKSWTSIEHAGHGYRSSLDAPLHFGLGATSQVDAIEVTWPSGARTTVTEVLGDRVITIAEP